MQSSERSQVGLPVREHRPLLDGLIELRFRTGFRSIGRSGRFRGAGSLCDHPSDHVREPNDRALLRS